jgi:flavin reductase (DIM6/NTAB) family NADH-FMN oxidoreductase RutF
MHELLLTHPTVGISILSLEQEASSRRFAAEEDDRFDGIPHRRGENGTVLLDEALAHMECRLITHHEGGDHTIFIAEIDRATPHASDGVPLLYYRGGYAQLSR